MATNDRARVNCARWPSWAKTSIVALCVSGAGCQDLGQEPEGGPAAAPSSAIAETKSVTSGQDIFRHDDFGSWRFWTDSLHLNDLVETVSPLTALQLGLKVDSDAVGPADLQAVLTDPTNPAKTVRLLELNAVLGLAATVEAGQVTRIGITCALCHSSVDDAVAAGIGRRMDGWPNRDLEVGTIISLTPGLDDVAPGAAGIYASWPAGFYDARFNQDGISDPTVIPPAYGLKRVGLETYTGEGPISYWNAYVAVTQMRGQGSFSDPLLGIDIHVPRDEDLVTSKLPELRTYQHSLEAPENPRTVDAAAAARGKLLFEGSAGCSGCHSGPLFTDGGNLHAPEETGMDPTHAERGTTGLYRTTPLRGLWQHPPYFHDGSAATLDAVVAHYNAYLQLGLREDERADLVAYLSTL